MKMLTRNGFFCWQLKVCDLVLPIVRKTIENLREKAGSLPPLRHVMCHDIELYCIRSDRGPPCIPCTSSSFSQEVVGNGMKKKAQPHFQKIYLWSPFSRLSLSTPFFQHHLSFNKKTKANQQKHATSPHKLTTFHDLHPPGSPRK